MDHAAERAADVVPALLIVVEELPGFEDLVGMILRPGQRPRPRLRAAGLGPVFGGAETGPGVAPGGGSGRRGRKRITPAPAGGAARRCPPQGGACAPSGSVQFVCPPNGPARACARLVWGRFFGGAKTGPGVAPGGPAAAAEAENELYPCPPVARPGDARRRAGPVRPRGQYNSFARPTAPPAVPNNRFTLRETLFLLVRQLAKQHGPTVTAGDLCQRQRFDMTCVYELRWIRW